MAEKKINGKTYKVDAVLATTAINIQVRLMKVLGAGIDQLPVILLGAGEGASPEAKASSDAAAIRAFVDIVSRSSPDEITELMKDIVELASVKGPSGTYERVDMDGCFTHDKQSLFPVVVFVLKETLGDFFTGLLANGGLGGLMKA